MSDKTGIEWCDATWNPVVGCTKVSPGCKNCYAEKLHEQRHKYTADQFLGGFESKLPAQYEKPFETIQLMPQRLDAPLNWWKPRRIFVNSMSDLFHEDVPDDFIDRVFAIMALCPQHIFQILTKRAKRMRAYFERQKDANGNRTNCKTEVVAAAGERTSWYENDDEWDHYLDRLKWPLPNVWLGVSVESDDYRERIDELRRTPAAVRFVSAEPLLGALDIADQLQESTLHHVSMSVSGALRNKAFEGLTDGGAPLSRAEGKARLEALHAQGVKLVSTGGCEGHSDQTGCPGHPLPGLDWVICGGESGPGARPMQETWAESLRDQCRAAGVAFFMKQMAKKTPIPDHLMIREYPNER